MADIVRYRHTPQGPTFELTEAFAALPPAEQRERLQQELAHCLERMEKADGPAAWREAAAAQEFLTYALACLDANAVCDGMTSFDARVHKPGHVPRPD